ncbi:MAG: DUF4157 domain-containing protein [Deltaproteobacteria bacterium]|nr:DUF4157 domain-containing protein [Deltaproteobacteria bacterium]
MLERLSSLGDNRGHELTEAVRTPMEHRLGADLSHVRVHDNSLAADLCHSLGTSAFSLGNHVVFGRNHYQPNTPRGQRLLAHELTHTVQTDSAAVVRRSPPQDEIDQVELMQRMLSLIYDDRADEIRIAELTRLSDFRLEIVLDMAMAKMKERMKDSLNAPNEIAQQTFDFELGKATGLAKSIKKLQMLRQNIVDSAEFAQNAQRVRALLGSDDKCFFDVVLHRVPKYLKALLKGGEESPTETDRLYGGYLSESAALVLTAGGKDKAPLTQERILDQMSVVPKKLAYMFFTAGSGDGLVKIKDFIEKEREALNAGKEKVNDLEEKLGSGAGNTSVEHLAYYLSQLYETPGTLYFCHADDEKDREAYRNIVAGWTAEMFESLPEKLVPTHEIMVEGVAWNDEKHGLPYIRY